MSKKGSKGRGHGSMTSSEPTVSGDEHNINLYCTIQHNRKNKKAVQNLFRYACHAGIVMAISFVMGYYISLSPSGHDHLDSQLLHRQNQGYTGNFVSYFIDSTIRLFAKATKNNQYKNKEKPASRSSTTSHNSRNVQHYEEGEEDEYEEDECYGDEEDNDEEEEEESCMHMDDEDESGMILSVGGEEELAQIGEKVEATKRTVNSIASLQTRLERALLQRIEVLEALQHQYESFDDDAIADDDDDDAELLALFREDTEERVVEAKGALEKLRNLKEKAKESGFGAQSGDLNVLMSNRINMQLNIQLSEIAEVLSLIEDPEISRLTSTSSDDENDDDGDDDADPCDTASSSSCPSTNSEDTTEGQDGGGVFKIHQRNIDNEERIKETNNNRNGNWNRARSHDDSSGDTKTFTVHSNDIGMKILGLIKKVNNVENMVKSSPLTANDSSI